MFSSSAKIVKPNGEKPDEFESGISQVSVSPGLRVSSPTPRSPPRRGTHGLRVRPQALLELEMNSDLKAQLRELNITAAKVSGDPGSRTPCIQPHGMLRFHAWSLTRDVDLLQVFRPSVTPHRTVAAGGVFHKFLEIEVGGGRKAIIIFVPVPQLKSFQKIQVRLVRELEKKFSGKHVVFIAQRRILPKPTRKSRTKNKQKRPRSRTLTAVHDAILEDLVFPSEIVGKRIRVKLDGSRLIKVHLDKAQQNNVEHKVETFSGVYKKLTGKDVNFEFPEFQL
ncbi:hypothetical protein ACRRTK_005271 [Alexandromys fortis]